MIMPDKIKRFTENDWDGFAGAECFEDNSNPFIFELENGFGIADRNGINLFFGEDGEEAWELEVKMGPEKISQFIQLMFPEKWTYEELSKFGFIRIV